MTRIRGVYLMAGTMVLVSVALGHFVSEWWYLLTVFVGVNLVQASFTGICPAEMILARLGVPESAGLYARPTDAARSRI